MTLRVALVCPGRGSYGREQLGTLPAEHSVVARLDAFRASLGRVALTSLDGEPFSPRLHLAGEHASLLTFAATLVDAAAVMHGAARARVVAVTGNSMGWYTALCVAGSLELTDAAHLVETMGAWQAPEEHGVVGAQVLYPVADDAWRSSPELQAAVDRACEHPGVFLSIRLGGTAVLGLTREALRALPQLLPTVERGGRQFPLQLPLHSAFHTPLMQPTAVRALRELGHLRLRSPRVPLFAGDGSCFRPFADPAAVLRYTLTTQVTEPYDLTRAVTVLLGEHAPDALVALGPGDTLGAPLGQVLVGLGWRGLRDRQDFLEAQGGERPLVLSMARPEQRRLVAG